MQCPWALHFLWLKVFKNWDPAFFYRGIVIFFAAQRPADALDLPDFAHHPNTEAFAVGKVKCDEIRFGEKRGHIPGHYRLEIERHVLSGEEVFGKLTSYYIRAVLFQPGDTPGVKGFDTVKTLVVIQQIAYGLTQGGVVAPVGFQLYDQGRIALI